MTTIEILPIITNEKTIYQAICGTIKATGLTPGEALDLTLESLNSVDDTVVILQRFHGDDLFTQQQQTRLVEMMEDFHKSVASGNPQSRFQQQELENLLEAELKAALSRSERILQQTQPPHDETLK